MEKLFVIVSFILLIMACGGTKTPDTTTDTKPSATSEPSASSTPTYDPNRGEGKWTAENLALSPTIDAAKADLGSKIREVKCTSCHKLSGEKLVGPGWKGVTQRRTPEWIMNFITNPDPMISKDPAVQAQLELCLVRMPNQNLTDDDAKAILEFMRKNDGVQ